MSIRITCPGCEAPLTLADTMAGKKVRCTSCKKVLAIPASKKKVLAGGDEPDEEAIREDEKLQVKAKARDADDDADGGDDEDSPKKKKKKKKKGKQGNLALIVGGASVLVVLLLVGGAAALVFALKPDEEKKKQAQQVLADLKNKDAKGNLVMKDNVKDQAAPMPNQPVQPQGKDGGFRIIPKIQDGNPNAKKGGDNIVSSIRGSGYRLERQSELSNIGKSYIQYSDDFKGANRNMKSWLEYIKTFGPIRDAVAEGYYKMNFNATLDGGSVIAYERDIDKGTHLCVRGSGQVEYVPVAELKAILGRDP
jgi:hypothetical protein